jgi:uncharacterized protein (TIGR02246 family)
MSDLHRLTTFHLAESAIRQLHARCADAVWRKDGVAFADCFVEDGEWIIAGVHARGRAQIAAEFETFLNANERVLMQFGTPILSLDDRSAHGRTYITETIKTVDGRAMTTIGAYYEQFALTGGGWRFTKREFDLHYFGAPDLSGPFFDCPDRGPPPAVTPEQHHEMRGPPTHIR